MVSPIYELSDEELSALIEKVEAAQPLNHRYFHWIEHLRRYLLFYWSLGLLPEMILHASSGNPSLSLLILVVPVVSWFVSPRLADVSLDVRETVGEVIYRCAQTKVSSYSERYYLRPVRWILWWAVLYSMIYAATHLPPLITCCTILVWCALYQRFTSAPASSYDLSRITKYLDWQENEVQQGNPLMTSLGWVVGIGVFFIVCIVALKEGESGSLDGLDGNVRVKNRVRTSLACIVYSALFCMVLVHLLPWNPDHYMIGSVLVASLVWFSTAFTSSAYHKWKKFSIFYELNKHHAVKQ